MLTIANIRVAMSTKTMMNIALGELCTILWIYLSICVHMSYLGLFSTPPLWILFALVELRRIDLIFMVKEDALVELCESMNT